MKNNIAIQITNLSKQYKLGTVSTGTLSHDLKRWWHLACGKEDPFLKIGDINVRSKKSSSGYVWALKDINFEVQQGEVLGIIGKNGAGKSTLLKILSRVTGPTTGAIKYRGRIGALLEVGTGFHAELTGRENIFLNGAILGMTRVEIKAKFDEIVDFSGVGKYVDTPVKRYSSGMMVRLGFAVAAFLEPEILVVDEVLAVGDAEFQKKAIGKMQDVSKNAGRTVLFVSHNMAAVESLCTRAILICDGYIKKNGTTTSVIQDYLNEHNSLLSINQRTDRKGNGILKITEIKLVNHHGDNVRKVMSGRDLEIHLFFTIRNNYLTKNNDIDIGLQIFDNMGKFITVLNNKMANFRITTNLKNGKIICKLPELPLMYGNFFVTINAKYNGDTADYIERALSFSVDEGDFFKSGNPNTGGRQGVYLKQQWELSS